MPRTIVVPRVNTEEAFQSLRVDGLKPLARLITSEVPPRKGELAELVTRTMQDPAQIRAIYEGMSELNQAAVREATHESEGNLDAARFQAKYGQKPNYGAGGSTTALRLFFPIGGS